MKPYIKNIHINKLFHLSNFDIPVDNMEYPHLLITGKIGSGKTIPYDEEKKVNNCIAWRK